MRVLLVALMIALLPVRGWLGDAMALSMAASALVNGSGPVSAAGSALPETAQAAPPCHEEAHATAGLGEPSTLDAHAHHAVHAAQHPQDTGPHCHSLCDVCNGPVIATALPVMAALGALPGMDIPASERFASQLARRDVRPPIA